MANIFSTRQSVSLLLEPISVSPAGGASPLHTCLSSNKNILHRIYFPSFLCLLDLATPFHHRLATGHPARSTTCLVSGSPSFTIRDWSADIYISKRATGQRLPTSRVWMDCPELLHRFEPWPFSRVILGARMHPLLPSGVNSKPNGVGQGAFCAQNRINNRTERYMFNGSRPLYNLGEGSQCLHGILVGRNTP